MGWPCRVELWGELMESAKADYAGVANAIAAFEPVIMVVSTAADGRQARAALSGQVEVVEIALDDSWMRDNGPVFCLDGRGRRAGVHFRFNAWGGKYRGWARDEQAGGVLARRYGDATYEAPMVLEGGSVIVDASGRAVTTEQCLLHPNRNPGMSRSDIALGLAEWLGVTEVIWLGRGLVDDRDTDGHVDLIAAFGDDGSLVLQHRPPGDPDHETMADNRRRAAAAGLTVIDFEPLTRAEVAGRAVVLSYLNLYRCNGAIIVPLAGGAHHDIDQEALLQLGRIFPGRQVVGVAGLTIAAGGGGPHCTTQQIPVRTTA